MFKKHFHQSINFPEELQRQTSDCIFFYAIVESALSLISRHHIYINLTVNHNPLIILFFSVVLTTSPMQTEVLPIFFVPSFFLSGDIETQ